MPDARPSLYARLAAKLIAKPLARLACAIDIDTRLAARQPSYHDAAHVENTRHHALARRVDDGRDHAINSAGMFRTDANGQSLLSENDYFASLERRRYAILRLLQLCARPLIGPHLGDAGLPAKRPRRRASQRHSAVSYS